MCDLNTVKKLVIFVVAMIVISQVVRTIEAFATMSYYLDPTYFSVWSKVMMPTAGPPPTSFYVISLVFSAITWGLFGYVFCVLGSAIRAASPVKKGLLFGTYVFLLAGLSGTLSMYLLFNLPLGLLVSWLVSGLVLYLIGGVLAAKLVPSCCGTCS